MKKELRLEIREVQNGFQVSEITDHSRIYVAKDMDDLCNVIREIHAKLAAECPCKSGAK